MPSPSIRTLLQLSTVVSLLCASAIHAPSASAQQPRIINEAPASINFPAENTDFNDTGCDKYADSPSDPTRVGSGVELDQIEIPEAIGFCDYAAEWNKPPRPRYVYLYGRVLFAQKKYEQARHVFIRADVAGSAMAAMALGDMYLNGLGGEQDTDEALRLFRRAGDAGVPDAFANAGVVYLSTNPPNHAESARLFARASALGSSAGDYYLGLMYRQGLGVPRDPYRAAKLLQRSYKAGNLQANFLLAVMYQTGEGGLPRDPRGAVEMLAASAAAGDPYAQVELGNCYYNGNGVTANRYFAFNWYAKAAFTGLPEAQEFIAYMYETGDSIVPDQEKAVVWYRNAANQGLVRAMTELGVHLRQGNGTPWNEAEAMQWFEKAAAQGDVQAMTAAGLGLKDGLGGGSQDYPGAAHYFAQAAQRNDGFAALNLGYLYEQGWGVPQDSQRAKAYYAQASRDPNPKVAALGAEYFDGVREVPAPVEQRSTVSSSSQSSDFWTTVVVGALAVGAISALTSNSTSSSSSSPAEAPTPDFNQTAAQQFNDHVLDRMAQGCLWSMDTTGFGGSCNH